jgi:hypothetical protein
MNDLIPFVKEATAHFIKQGIRDKNELVHLVTKTMKNLDKYAPYYDDLNVVKAFNEDLQSNGAIINSNRILDVISDCKSLVKTGNYDQYQFVTPKQTKSKGSGMSFQFDFDNLAPFGILSEVIEKMQLNPLEGIKALIQFDYHDLVEHPQWNTLLPILTKIFQEISGDEVIILFAVLCVRLLQAFPSNSPQLDDTLDLSFRLLEIGSQQTFQLETDQMLACSSNNSQCSVCLNKLFRLCLITLRNSCNFSFSDSYVNLLQRSIVLMMRSVGGIKCCEDIEILHEFVRLAWIFRKIDLQILSFELGFDEYLAYFLGKVDQAYQQPQDDLSHIYLLILELIGLILSSRFGSPEYVANKRLSLQQCLSGNLPSTPWKGLQLSPDKLKHIPGSNKLFFYNGFSEFKLADTMSSDTTFTDLIQSIFTMTFNSSKQHSQTFWIEFCELVYRTFRWSTIYVSFVYQSLIKVIDNDQLFFQLLWSYIEIITENHSMCMLFSPKVVKPFPIHDTEVDVFKLFNYIASRLLSGDISGLERDHYQQLLLPFSCCYMQWYMLHWNEFSTENQIFQKQLLFDLLIATISNNIINPLEVVWIDKLAHFLTMQSLLLTNEELSFFLSKIAVTLIVFSLSEEQYHYIFVTTGLKILTNMIALELTFSNDLLTYCCHLFEIIMKNPKILVSSADVVYSTEQVDIVGGTRNLLATALFFHHQAILTWSQTIINQFPGLIDTISLSHQELWTRLPSTLSTSADTNITLQNLFITISSNSLNQLAFVLHDSKNISYSAANDISVDQANSWRHQFTDLQVQLQVSSSSTWNSRFQDDKFIAMFVDDSSFHSPLQDSGFSAFNSFRLCAALVCSQSTDNQQLQHLQENYNQLKKIFTHSSGIIAGIAASVFRSSFAEYEVWDHWCNSSVSLEVAIRVLLHQWFLSCLPFPLILKLTEYILSYNCVLFPAMLASAIVKLMSPQHIAGIESFLGTTTTVNTTDGPFDVEEIMETIIVMLKITY